MNCWHPVLSFLEKLNALTYLSKHALQTETALVMQIKKWLHEVKCNVQKRWLIRCSQWTRQTRLGGWSNIFSIPTYLPVQRLEKFEYSFVASLVAGVVVGHGSSGEICVGSLLGISNESFLLSLTMKETKRKKKKKKQEPSLRSPSCSKRECDAWDCDDNHCVTWCDGRSHCAQNGTMGTQEEPGNWWYLGPLFWPWTAT